MDNKPTDFFDSSLYQVTRQVSDQTFRGNASPSAPDTSNYPQYFDDHHHYCYVQIPYPMYRQPALNMPQRKQTIIPSKTVKTVELDRNGCLIVRTPVPRRVLQYVNAQDGIIQEFTHMKYMAVCGEPDQFVPSGYPLRAQVCRRVPELFIVVTMASLIHNLQYNEDEQLFSRTWKAIRKNVAYLCSKNKGPWGPSGWQKVVICIIADGREKIHPKTLNTMGVLGCYQEGHIKTSINNQPVSAHVFEYTTQVTLDNDVKYKSSSSGIPIQMIFCIKEKNAKKINSHRWFFNAFGRLLQPKVCILLDVGTKPTEKSFYRLWKEFERNPDVAGACGEIYVQTDNGLNLFNPLVAAQNFEYKIR